MFWVSVRSTSRVKTTPSKFQAKRKKRPQTTRHVPNIPHSASRSVSPHPRLCSVWGPPMHPAPHQGTLLTILRPAPTSFCKCTCFTNSTIIPLDAPRSLPSRPGEALFHRAPPAEGSHEDRKEFRAGNCNDCNRQYCIDAHLPICKDAGVNDIVATCFRAFSCVPFHSLRDGQPGAGKGEWVE